MKAAVANARPEIVRPSLLRRVYTWVNKHSCVICSAPIAHDETFCAKHLEAGKEMQRFSM